MEPTELQNIGSGSGLLGGALMGLASIWWAIRHVRSSSSSDATARKHDEAERKTIDRLEKEIERLQRAAADAMNEATKLRTRTSTQAARIASLEADQRYKHLEYERMMKDVQDSIRALPEAKRAGLPADVAALADIDERISQFMASEFMDIDEGKGEKR